MQTLVLTIHILIALALIGSVLLQRSEGGGLGIGGGGGGAKSLSKGRNHATCDEYIVRHGPFYYRKMRPDVSAKITSYGVFNSFCRLTIRSAARGAIQWSEQPARLEALPGPVFH